MAPLLAMRVSASASVLMIKVFSPSSLITSNRVGAVTGIPGSSSRRTVNLGLPGIIIMPIIIEGADPMNAAPFAEPRTLGMAMDHVILTFVGSMIVA
jgi:hypothetical protein